MSDLGILERFQEVVGCGTIYTRKNRIYNYEKINARKQQWAWRLGRYTDVDDVLFRLWPWLSERRRNRATEVLTIGAPTRGNKHSKVLEMAQISTTSGTAANESISM